MTTRQRKILLLLICKERTSSELGQRRANVLVLDSLYVDKSPSFKVPCFIKTQENCQNGTKLFFIPQRYIQKVFSGGGKQKLGYPFWGNCVNICVFKTKPIDFRKITFNSFHKILINVGYLLRRHYLPYRQLPAKILIYIDRLYTGSK